MHTMVYLLVSELRDTFRSRVARQRELMALRHPLTTMALRHPFTTMKRKRQIWEAFPWDTSPRTMIRRKPALIHHPAPVKQIVKA